MRAGWSAVARRAPGPSRNRRGGTGEAVRASPENTLMLTVIHVSMDQSNLDFLGKLFVAENETFLVGSILAILINYVVRNFKHYRTLLKGAMKAISANCCYQWELGQWTSHIG
jgi:hypothetical protein